MRRRHWFEIHEQAWFPKTLRDLTTDTLQFAWNFFGFYESIIPALRKALQETGTRRVVDLCSGGGGPWLSLIRRLENEEKFLIEVQLTDRFPNLGRSQEANGGFPARVISYRESVDATRVPAGLKGFRTLFTSFHHFSPSEAEAILQDALNSRQGVGIFEVPKRDMLTISLVLFMPLVALALGPFIRPFRWSRLLWTYLVPLIPFVLWFDGIVSCLRAYTPSELRELARNISPNAYTWESGEARRGLLPVKVTYLIGYPKNETTGQGVSLRPQIAACD